MPADRIAASPAHPYLPDRAGAPSDPLDAFVDPEIRAAIERRWCAPINEGCSLAQLLQDRRFVANPGGHVALFADHGTVHARDVARQIVQVLDIANGTLIPARDPDRLGWMKAYGVLLACVHDIGMVDFSPVGRAMHPEFATQAVLGPEFDGIMHALSASDRAGLAARAAGLAAPGRPPAMVLREMLAMANCHSKSKVPVALLNDRAALRRTMQAVAATDLLALYQAQKAAGPGGPLPAGVGFAWLEARDGPACDLVDDVIDTLRALRCADALRQRGTVLKTSGNFEIFVDARSANAVYALRPDSGHLYLLEVADPIAAGEANLASSQLDANGDLRISFHHGAFADRETVLKAARSAALIVNDVQADAVGSFAREDDHPGLRRHEEIAILLETVEENPAFAPLVRQELQTLDPAAAARVRIVASLDVGSPAERRRYLASTDVGWDLAARRAVLEKVVASGHRTAGIDPDAAFREVRRITLPAGETLIEAGTPSSFVYIPMQAGLRGLPLGGYPGFVIPPWVPVGVTGVIRGGVRNAQVRAERDLELLAIPKGVFLDQWHATYDPASFATLVRDLAP